MESNLRNRIIIDITPTNDVTVNVYGDMTNDIALIGACAVAEQFVKNKLLSNMKLIPREPQNHIHNSIKNCYSEDEIEMQKNDAMNFFLEKRKDIENRLQEIVREKDNQATFKIKKFDI